MGSLNPESAGLIANTRPGSLEVTGQQRELFPFDAFEYAYDELNGDYRVRVKLPWQFEIKGLSADQLYEALAVDPDNIGDPLLTTWSGNGIGRMVEFRASYPAGLGFVPSFDVQISQDGINWYKPALDTLDGTVWNAGAGYLSSRSSNFIQGPMPLTISGTTGTPVATTYQYRFRTYNPLVDNMVIAWGAALTVTVVPVRPGEIFAEAITAANIAAGAVTAGKITASTALIDDLFASQAEIDQLFSKTATVTNTLTLGTGGTVQAASGTMVLSADGSLRLGSVDNVVVLSAVDAGYRLWAGASLPASAPFSVSIAGALKSTSGLIAGFTIDGTEGLYAGTGATRVQLKPGGGIWLGATAFADAPFSVSPAGALKSTSGTIGGWTIGALVLSSRSWTGSAFTGAGITLDDDEARVSIFDSSDVEKVAMGYLDGLPKYDGTGNWGPSDYGFWAKEGDSLRIDGDVTYESGSWLLESDSSVIIQNTSVLVRLGTYSARKGLFVLEGNLAYNAITGKPEPIGSAIEISAEQAFIGDAASYFWYKDGTLELKLTSFLVSTLTTDMLGTLRISGKTGDLIDSLTTPLTLTTHTDGTYGIIEHPTQVQIKINGSNRLSVNSTGMSATFVSSSGGGYIQTNLWVNGQIQGANGSVGTPAFGAYADTNTGIWFPAADTLAISTGGTERLRITSGINGEPNVVVQGDANTERMHIRSSADPVVLLGVHGGTVTARTSVPSGKSLGYYQFGGYDGSNYQRSVWLGAFAAETFSSTARGSYLVFSTTPTGSTTITERMRIDSSGNVGIGTSSPSAPLSVVGVIQSEWDYTTSWSQQVYIKRLASGVFDGSSLSIDVGMGQGLANIIGGASVNSSGSGYVYTGARGASRVNFGDGYLYFFTGTLAGSAGQAAGDPVTWSNSNAAAMVITSSGNVGIGTTTPWSNTRLHVAADTPVGSFQVVISGASYPGRQLLIGYDPTNNYAKIQAVEATIAYRNLALQQDGGNVHMCYGASGGKVGIGTDAPVSKLDVVAADSTNPAISGYNYNAGGGVYGRGQGYGVRGFLDSIGYAVMGNTAYYNSSTKFQKQVVGLANVSTALRALPLPMYRWAWEDSNMTGFDQFIAPFAEDLKKTFNLTDIDDGMFTVDGIALALGQELLWEVDALKIEVRKLKEKLNGITAAA